MFRRSHALLAIIAGTAGVACADHATAITATPAPQTVAINGVVALAPSAGAAATPLPGIQVTYMACQGDIIPIDTGGYYTTSNCQNTGSVVSGAAGTFKVDSLRTGTYVFKAAAPAGSGYRGGEAKYTAATVSAANDIVRVTFIGK